MNTVMSDDYNVVVRLDMLINCLCVYSVFQVTADNYKRCYCLCRETVLRRVCLLLDVNPNVLVTSNYNLSLQIACLNLANVVPRVLRFVVFSSVRRKRKSL